MNPRTPPILRDFLVGFEEQRGRASDPLDRCRSSSLVLLAVSPAVKRITERSTTLPREELRFKFKGMEWWAIQDLNL